MSKDLSDRMASNTTSEKESGWVTVATGVAHYRYVPDSEWQRLTEERHAAQAMGEFYRVENAVTGLENKHLRQEIEDLRAALATERRKRLYLAAKEAQG